jgi:hypothetical protein
MKTHPNGLQMASFCASGAHGLMSTPLRFSQDAIFAASDWVLIHRFIE